MSELFDPLPVVCVLSEQRKLHASPTLQLQTKSRVTLQDEDVGDCIPHWFNWFPCAVKYTIRLKSLAYPYCHLEFESTPSLNIWTVAAVYYSRKRFLVLLPLCLGKTWLQMIYQNRAFTSHSMTTSPATLPPPYSCVGMRSNLDMR